MDNQEVPLRFECNTAQDFRVVAVEGEINTHNSYQLRERLISLISDAGAAGETPKAIVDLNAVSFLDSTGLGMLVGILRRFKACDGDLRLVVAQGPIHRLFMVVGLTKIFAIFPSLDDALRGPELTAG